jgi:hypothetical protein
VKHYTADEANALLPYLAPTLVELREKFEEAQRIRETVAEAAVGNGGSKKRARWARTLERVQELIERLEEWEIVLRDFETGLVDFPSTIAGEDVYLCWRLGEPEVAYWHRPDEGFGGRHPL